ncbi:DsrE family protein [Myxococcota bacterium]|nr:DsrE family protein [Myxococcota bacterium]
MVAFLLELAKSDTEIHMVGCLNSAITFTTAEGDALEALRLLEHKGARIATCGTCLDYHGLRDSLLIGEAGNMAQAVSLLTTADRIIRPN